MNKKTFFKAALLIALFLSLKGAAVAADVNLTIRDGSSIVFTGAVALPTGVTSLNDAESSPHTIDASSVLAVLASADETSADFSISNLTYFSSFGSLYLKCITDANGEKCDDWQYTVNDTYPGIGMDQNILVGGENVYVYFGPQNKVILNSNSITTSNTLTVTTQKYDYQNNTWVARNAVTVGLTQPDPLNSFSPTEILTNPVDTNGQATFSAISAGSYNVGIKEDFYFPTEILVVTLPPPPVQSHPSGGGGGLIMVSNPVTNPISSSIKLVFDLKKAFEFLFTEQKENGSFGEDLYTDWTAMALASGNYQKQTINLIKYLTGSKLISTLLTDYERRAMALMALGLNPYNTNGENYIEKISASFDGKQFGDVNEDNDDVFALIVLQNAGYSQNEKIISDDLAFILGRQRESGSWDESVDMTGAGIQALSVFQDNEQIKASLAKAKEFLQKTQKENGGWGDSASSTVWAIEGILALGEKPEDWIKKSNTPLDYLATQQDTDGGIKDENIKNKIWETAYVASVLSGKTWNQIMQKFEKPNMQIAIETPPKPVKKHTTKKIVAKKDNISAPTDNTPITNTATVITALTNQLEETKTETPKKGWFTRLLESIFGF